MDIRHLRRAARLTQLELAQQTGISRCRLSFAECGYCELKRQELTLIKDAIAREPQRRAVRVRVAGGTSDGDARAV